MQIELVERFMSLFVGNERSFGQCAPDGNMKTIKDRKISIEIFKRHLMGEMGMGTVPIMDDGNCHFGVIDIDAHDTVDGIDLMDLEIKVRKQDLPLSVCRSRSGSAHLLLFGAEPLKASLVRTALSKWADLLGHGGCEIFPKQNALLWNDDKTRQLGNWINLCYFDAENKDQLRYSIEGGKKVPLEYFLDLAESRKMTGAVLVERSDTDHNGAPPCIQKMISNGVASGDRNLAMYNLVVYLKKAYPETWRDKAYDLNAKMFDIPLSHAEAKKTINSAGRRDYRYKCREEPCKSRCNAAVCVTRKHGITPEENNEMSLGKSPGFDNLRKITTEPVRWLMAVDGQDIILATAELMDYRRVREAIADRLTRLIAPMKNEQWQGILHPLMQSAVIIEAPDEASQSGILRAKLDEFIQKADLKSEGRNTKDREILYSGAPVVQVRKEKDTEERVVYFRGKDFIDFLKKDRSAELKGSNLWMAVSAIVRAAGVNHCNLRIGSATIRVWYVPVSNKFIELEGVEIGSEF